MTKTADMEDKKLYQRSQTQINKIPVKHLEKPR